MRCTMQDCDFCIMEERIQKLEEETKSNARDHREFEKHFSQIEMSNQKHEFLINTVIEKLDKLNEKIERIENKSAEDMSYFKRAIISAIGSAVGAGIVGAIIFYLP